MIMLKGTSRYAESAHGVGVGDDAGCERSKRQKRIPKLSASWFPDAMPWCDSISHL